MSKRLILLPSLLFSLGTAYGVEKMAEGQAVNSSAKPKYGMAGCGLGSVVFGASGNQVSAATTNGTSYNQPFAITSGTSNCVQTPEETAYLQQREFLSANLVSLEKELAQGGGETPRALLEIIGCQKDKLAGTDSQLATHYSVIFNEPGVTQILGNIKQVIVTDQALAQACPAIVTAMAQRSANI